MRDSGPGFLNSPWHGRSKGRAVPDDKNWKRPNTPMPRGFVSSLRQTNRGVAGPGTRHREARLWSVWRPTAHRLQESPCVCVSTGYREERGRACARVPDTEKREAVSVCAPDTERREAVLLCVRLDLFQWKDVKRWAQVGPGLSGCWWPWVVLVSAEGSASGPQGSPGFIYTQSPAAVCIPARSSRYNFLTQKKPGEPRAEARSWRLHTETGWPGRG